MFLQQCFLVCGSIRVDSSNIMLLTFYNFMWPFVPTELICSGFSIRIWVGGKTLGAGGEWNTRAEGARFSGGPGVFSPGKFQKFGPLRMHFLHSRARIRVCEQNRKHKLPLKLLRIQARFFVFHEQILADPGPLLWRMFLMLVINYEVISQSNRRRVNVE